MTTKILSKEQNNQISSFFKAVYDMPLKGGGAILCDAGFGNNHIAKSVGCMTVQPIFVRLFSFVPVVFFVIDDRHLSSCPSAPFRDKNIILVGALNAKFHHSESKDYIIKK